MANDLVPQPKRPGSNGNGNGHGKSNGNGNGNGRHQPIFKPLDNQVYDPLVPAGFVDTDRQTAGLEWDLPPVHSSGYLRRRSRREAQEHAQEAEAQAANARVRGDDGFAAMREIDAAEIRQGLMDWGDLKTWSVIFAMFFGFLLFVAFVYFMPQGRHNQNDGPAPVPNIRVY